jgi:hypothetical protein
MEGSAALFDSAACLFVVVARGMNVFISRQIWLFRPFLVGIVLLTSASFFLCAVPCKKFYYIYIYALQSFFVS